MKEVKELPTHITQYVCFVKSTSPTGSYWSFGIMSSTKEDVVQYCNYYKTFKIFEVELPI